MTAHVESRLLLLMLWVPTVPGAVSIIAATDDNKVHDDESSCDAFIAGLFESSSEPACCDRCLL